MHRTPAKSTRAKKRTAAEEASSSSDDTDYTVQPPRASASTAAARRRASASSTSSGEPFPNIRAAVRVPCAAAANSIAAARLPQIADEPEVDDPALVAIADAPSVPAADNPWAAFRAGSSETGPKLAPNQPDASVPSDPAADNAAAQTPASPDRSAGRPAQPPPVIPSPTVPDAATIQLITSIVNSTFISLLQEHRLIPVNNPDASRPMENPSATAAGPTAGPSSGSSRTTAAGTSSSSNGGRPRTSGRSPAVHGGDPPQPSGGAASDLRHHADFLGGASASHCNIFAGAGDHHSGRQMRQGTSASRSPAGLADLYDQDYAAPAVDPRGHPWSAGLSSSARPSSSFAEAQRRAAPPPPPLENAAPPSSVQVPQPSMVAGALGHSLMAPLGSLNIVPPEPFDTEDPDSWFERLESGLRVARVPRSEWILYVQRVLPKEWASSVRRHLRHLAPDVDQYDEARTLLLNLTQPGAAHARRLANLPTLGSRRPSELMHLFISLIPTGEDFSDFHLHHFLMRLPRRLANPYRNYTMRRIGNPLSFAIQLDLEHADQLAYTSGEPNAVQQVANPDFGPPLHTAKQKGASKAQGTSNNRQQFRPRPFQQGAAANPASAPAQRPAPAQRQQQTNQAQRPNAPRNSRPAPTNRSSQQPRPSATAPAPTPGAATVNNDDCYFHQRFGADAFRCNGPPCPWAAQADEVEAGDDEEDTPIVSEEEFAEQIQEDDEDEDLAQYYLGTRRINHVLCSGSNVTPTFNKTIFLCKITRIPFLIDTGATSSFIPQKISDVLTSKPFKAHLPIKVAVANGNVETLENKIILKLDIGFGPTSWNFWIGNFTTPILGHDFLQFHNLLVNPAKHSLVQLHVAKGLTSPIFSYRSPKKRSTTLKSCPKTPVRLTQPLVISQTQPHLRLVRCAVIQ